MGLGENPEESENSSDEDLGEEDDSEEGESEASEEEINEVKKLTLLSVNGGLAN